MKKKTQITFFLFVLRRTKKEANRNEPILCGHEFCKWNREGNLETLNLGADLIGKKWKFKFKFVSGKPLKFLSG